METKLIRCERAISGEYLRAGETYAVEHEGRSSHFTRVGSAKGGSTSMKRWVFDDALANGSLAVAS